MGLQAAGCRLQAAGSSRGLGSGYAPCLNEYREQSAARAAAVNAAAVDASHSLAAQAREREEELRRSQVRDHMQPR
jgi:hypothetical protein